MADGAGSRGALAGNLQSPFARRVAGVFVTQVAVFALAFATSIVVSRILGPSGKGAYVAVTTLPGMLAAIGTLGLPSAATYFSGRGSSIASLLRAAVLLTATLSAVLVGLVWIALPWLESSFLRAAPDDMLRVILVTVPLGMFSSFCGSIFYGRQQIRVYNFILVLQAVATLVLSVLLVGVLRLGVPGAVATTVTVSAGLALAVMAAVRRAAQRDPSGPPARIRPLFGYALRLYPASVTGYFNYRADTYLIQDLIASPSGPLGLYSLAVTMAELIFYIPNSVGALFLPRVAGATREDANASLGRVARLTMLITAAAAVALVPVAFAGVHVVLPAFVDCLPAFYILLPGTVALSLSKVMTSFISGRGRPTPVSIGAIVVLIVNVSLNIVLIPSMGIAGAALASLVSYTLHAAMMLAVASRMSGQSPVSLVIPGRAEVSTVVDGSRRLIGYLIARGRGGAVPPAPTSPTPPSPPSEPAGTRLS